MKNIVIALVMSMLLWGCQQAAQAPEDGPETIEAPSTSEKVIPKEFAAYWYNGLAELNSYELDQVRYGIATRLMSDRSIRLVDVSQSSGYDDPSHFSRAFRRLAGVTPSQYRRTEH